MQQNRYQEALKQFSLIAKEHPFHAETQINLATCSLMLGLFEDAKQYYAHALAITPNDVQVLFNLGVINMQQGEVDSALQFYLQAVQLAPDLYEAEHNLGFIFLVKRDKVNALQHFQAALRLQPTNTALRHTIDIITGDKHLSISPPEYVRSLFNSYADHFDAHLVGALHYQVPRLMHQWIAERYDLARVDWTILDLGCGTGLCGELYQSVPGTLIGVDIAENMLAQALQKNVYDELVQSDILPYLADKKASFDLVIAGDVMVYFGDLAAFFKALQQAIKPGGLFIFNAEISDEEDYKMTSSGRFVHSKSYIDRLIEVYTFTLLQYELVTLRTQSQEAVRGHLYLLRR